MLNCNFGGKSFTTLRGYVLHCKVHRNEPRCLFKCFGDGCKQTFCRYGAFKAHFYRRHTFVLSANETVGIAVTGVEPDTRLKRVSGMDKALLLSTSIIRVIRVNICAWIE